MHGVNQLAASRPAQLLVRTGEGFCYSRHSLVLSRTTWYQQTNPSRFDLDVVFPLFWKVVLLVDGAHRTDRNTRATADTLVLLECRVAEWLLRRFFRFSGGWHPLDTRRHTRCLLRRCTVQQSRSHEFSLSTNEYLHCVEHRESHDCSDDFCHER